MSRMTAAIGELMGRQGDNFDSQGNLKPGMLEIDTIKLLEKMVGEDISAAGTFIDELSRSQDGEFFTIHNHISNNLHVRTFQDINVQLNDGETKYFESIAIIQAQVTPGIRTMPFMINTLGYDSFGDYMFCEYKSDITKGQDIPDHPGHRAVYNIFYDEVKITNKKEVLLSTHADTVQEAAEALEEMEMERD